MYHGALGGIQIGTEAVAYGTEAASLVTAPGISSGLKLIENRQMPPTLGGSTGNDPSTGTRIASHVEGPMQFAHVANRVIIGPLYVAAGGVFDTPSYEWDNGTDAIGLTSMSAVCSYAATGLSYTYLGLVPRSIQWNLLGGGQYATIDVDFIGQSVSKTAVAAPTAIAQASLVHTGGLVALGGVTLGHLRSATIRYERSVSGMERQAFATAVLPAPVLHAERPRITGTFTVDFNDDTVTALDNFLSGAGVGATMTCSGFSLGTPVCIGQIPDLTRGQIEATFTVSAVSLAVTTSA